VGNWILDRVVSKLECKQFAAIRGLVDILHMWHKVLDQSQVARVTFVDFSKAFDHVDHTVVINNLNALAIPGSVIKWFASFLTNRQQRVKIASNLSSWLNLKGGMPQGLWLGPLTFIIVIDNLKLLCLTHKYIDDDQVTRCSLCWIVVC